MKNFIIVLGLFLSSSFSFAQCLTAKPLPHCRTFFITEFGYGYKATSPLNRRTYTTLDDSTTFYEYRLTGRHLLSSELGVMHNLNANYGLGLTHFFGWDVGHHLHGGVKLRLRKWLSPKASFEISGGALLWGAEGEFEYPSFVGTASLNFNAWESLNLTVVNLRTPAYDHSYPTYDGGTYRYFAPQQRDLGVYLGYKFGSKPGLVLNAAALTTTAVVAAILISALSDD